MFDKKSYQKEHCQKNKEHYKEYSKVWRQNNKEHLKEYRYNKKEYMKDHYRTKSMLWAYLIPKYKEDPCMDCGTVYPFHVMQFDHRPGEIKDFGISTKNCRTASTKNINMIEAEIQKCDFVCANCHSDRTWQRRHNGD